MHQILRSAVLVASVVCTLGAALSWGQLPPTNDKSENGNTGSGTGALIVNTTGNLNTAFGRNALNSNTEGSGNTASGFQALGLNTEGSGNTASGVEALFRNTTGSYNTASGFKALTSNTTGSYNTASGLKALFFNTEGSYNTATGVDALVINTTGSYNTASGFNALQSNLTGDSNTASGASALFTNTEGFANTASGDAALYSNTEGYYNTATGVQALYFNSSGYENTASGVDALHGNTTGVGNTASGVSALFTNDTGKYNTALGYQALNHSVGNRNLALGVNAGSKLTSGDKNIYLGHPGAVTESNTMRLGQPAALSRTFIAGIYDAALSSGTPKAVYINSSGQVGLLASAARYKRDIAAMGAHSEGLYQLRPVTFRYKQDGQGQTQYGLIAEEVAKVYPELVTKGADGKVESVQYHELIPMLLNEVQHQQQELAELKAQYERLQAALVQQHAAVAARLEQLEQASHGGTVAAR